MKQFEVEMIYFDMDGVLADFERGVEELCGIIPPSQNEKRCKAAGDDEMWKRIREIEHFYNCLKLMPGAKDMFDAVYSRYKEKCEILTGIPKPKRGIVNAAEDKKIWVHRLLSRELKVNIVYREEKSKYCMGKGCILIDDMQKNINEWNMMGGTGIRHISAEDTVKQLKELGVL